MTAAQVLLLELSTVPSLLYKAVKAEVDSVQACVGAEVIGFFSKCQTCSAGYIALALPYPTC